MQQRYYDPVAGRFMSVDAVLTDANTGTSFNRYVYGNNSPYKYIDPDGRDATQTFNWGPNYETRIHSDPKSLIDKPTFKNEKGAVQCVEIVKQTVGNGEAASTWRQGPAVDQNTKPGTPIANFNDKGKMDSENTGQHAAILLKPADKNGTIQVVDQFKGRKDKNGNPVDTIQPRSILKQSPTVPTPSNNAKDYNVILFNKENKK